MARPYPPSTRATNTDRDTVLTLLDAAYADGQLKADEHDLRVELVTEATTLGDLGSLVEDLQDAAPPQPTTSIPDSASRPDPAVRARRFLAATVTAALVAGVAGFWFAGRDDAVAGPVAAPGEAVDFAGLPARVIPTPDLRTEAGLRQFIDDYRAEFGDTVVDVLYLYETRAGFERALPREANRKVDYDYRYGFTPDGDPETRPLDTLTVDLAAIDVAALGRVIEEAPARVNVPDGTVTSMSVEDRGYGDGPGIDIHVGNAFGESGWLRVTPAGDLIDVYRFGQ